MVSALASSSTARARSCRWTPSRRRASEAAAESAKPNRRLVGSPLSRALHESARDSGDPTSLLFGFADSAAASLARLREGVQRQDLARAVELLAKAETIYCIGQRRAFSVVHYMTYA